MYGRFSLRYRKVPWASRAEVPCRTSARWLAWRRGLCCAPCAVMRLREQHMAQQSQPETARWINKGYSLVSSPGLRLAFTGVMQLTHGPTGPWVSLHPVPVNGPSATGSGVAGVPWTPATVPTVPYGTLYIEIGTRSTVPYGTLYIEYGTRSTAPYGTLYIVYTRRSLRTAPYGYLIYITVIGSSRTLQAEVPDR